MTITDVASAKKIVLDAFPDAEAVCFPDMGNIYVIRATFSVYKHPLALATPKKSEDEAWLLAAETILHAPE